MTDTGLIEVKAGQVWADNDPRCNGRKIEVLQVVETPHAKGHDYAICKVVADREDAVMPTVGRETRIRLDRFRPNSKGYVFVQDWPL